MAIRLASTFLAISLVLDSSSASASLVSTMEVVAAPDGAAYDYSITLQNTGTTTIGTLWFAWVPGQNYLATSPTAVSSPANWSEVVTHDRPTDGYGIEWTANNQNAFLAPGDSLTFGFTSTDTPASVAGNSVYYPGTPTTTSFVYSQGPFSDAGYQFTGSVTAVPEPSSWALVGVFLTALGLSYVTRNRPTQTPRVAIS